MKIFVELISQSDRNTLILIKGWNDDIGFCGTSYVNSNLIGDVESSGKLLGYVE